MGHQEQLYLRGEYYTLSRNDLILIGSSPHMWRTAIAINSALCFIGSSPLTWRLLCVIRNFTSGPRIISTYVENTLKAMLVQLRKQDHLHIRGEHEIVSMLNVTGKGSSPLTWRTLKANEKLLFSERIISTYVENT